LAVSTPISALSIKCVKDEFDKLHAHLIERVESLEKQLESQQKWENRFCNSCYDIYLNDFIIFR
jgi:hypothetical protein